jgi:3',5'-cyclic AMP phosphodiesterase CpdA
MPIPRRRDLLGKRLTGYLNWKRGRSKNHNMVLLKAIVEDMKRQNPDHIAMTGDILNIGLSAEFPLAKSWLETLGSCAEVSFVPGNHDAYTRAAMPQLTQTFAPWLKDEGQKGKAEDAAGFEQSESQYPYLRQRENIALIGLSSAVPTLPFLASGRLGQMQLRAFERFLGEAGKQGLVRVVMLHHPPLATASHFGRGLTDARDFEAVLGQYGAELVIHGHNHRLSVKYIKGPLGLIPVVGVPSASAVRSAGYHIFKISGSARAFQIEASTRGLLSGSSHIGDLGAIKL